MDSHYALVDTTPKDKRGAGSVNLGQEIVAYDSYGDAVDLYDWYEEIPPKRRGCYGTVLFNVIYPTNVFNIVPFLRNNGIEPLKDKRNGKPRIVAGGQGASVLNCLDDIVDENFKGEIDYNFDVQHALGKPAKRIEFDKITI